MCRLNFLSSHKRCVDEKIAHLWKLANILGDDLNSNIYKFHLITSNCCCQCCCCCYNCFKQEMLNLVDLFVWHMYLFLLNVTLHVSMNKSATFWINRFQIAFNNVQFDGNKDVTAWNSELNNQRDPHHNSRSSSSFNEKKKRCSIKWQHKIINTSLADWYKYGEWEWENIFYAQHMITFHYYITHSSVIITF